MKVLQVRTTADTTKPQNRLIKEGQKKSGENCKQQVHEKDGGGSWKKTSGLGPHHHHHHHHPHQKLS